MSNRAVDGKARHTRGREPQPAQNHLLAALSPEVQGRLFPHLELAELPLRSVMYEAGRAMRHVYFPTDSIISLQYVMENGASTAISVVGNEGLLGITLYMGGESTPSRSLVQNRLTMTREFISHMLGVRRSGVSVAAAKLEKLGVIAYQRGLITVLDRKRLEALSCECYASVKRETDLLLHYLPQRQIVQDPAAIPTVQLPQA
ncbi:Crp/Fnr family transcriptional regulator [Caenimonas koreensis]|uniref:Crp/Fnr family transcriptional regulator n=1 Tax=Caenimonas koreensis TaxID=367474 RepID=UPI003784FCB9